MYIHTMYINYNKFVIYSVKIVLFHVGVLPIFITYVHHTVHGIVNNVPVYIA